MKVGIFNDYSKNYIYFIIPLCCVISLVSGI